MVVSKGGGIKCEVVGQAGGRGCDHVEWMRECEAVGGVGAHLTL